MLWLPRSQSPPLLQQAQQQMGQAPALWRQMALQHLALHLLLQLSHVRKASAAIHSVCVCVGGGGAGVCVKLQACVHKGIHRARAEDLLGWLANYGWA
jgi:hypothetical protein